MHAHGIFGSFWAGFTPDASTMASLCKLTVAVRVDLCEDRKLDARSANVSCVAHAVRKRNVERRPVTSQKYAAFMLNCVSRVLRRNVLNITGCAVRMRNHVVFATQRGMCSFHVSQDVSLSRETLTLFDLPPNEAAVRKFCFPGSWPTPALEGPFVAKQWTTIGGGKSNKALCKNSFSQDKNTFHTNGSFSTWTDLYWMSHDRKSRRRTTICLELRRIICSFFPNKQTEPQVCLDAGFTLEASWVSQKKAHGVVCSHLVHERQG